jgi:hypothetical protein
MRRTPLNRRSATPKCKNCKTKFTPQGSELFCSNDCRDEFAQKAIAKAKKNRERAVKKAKAESRKEIRGLREKHKGLQYYKRELKAILHRYVRMRDEDKDCAACGRSMQGRKGDAGHFWSVGSYPNLQFDERNIHLCCVPCNQFRGGNLIEYGLRLPNIIGQEAFDDLKAKRQTRASFTIPELKEKIEYYKLKVAELEK